MSQKTKVTSSAATRCLILKASPKIPFFSFGNDVILLQGMLRCEEDATAFENESLKFSERISAEG